VWTNNNYSFAPPAGKKIPLKLQKKGPERDKIDDSLTSLFGNSVPFHVVQQYPGNHFIFLSNKASEGAYCIDWTTHIYISVRRGKSHRHNGIGQEELQLDLLRKQCEKISYQKRWFIRWKLIKSGGGWMESENMKTVFKLEMHSWMDSFTNQTRWE